MSMISQKNVGKLKDMTDGKCFYCGCTLPKNTDLLDEGGKVVVTIRNWHIEHVIPRSRGGANKMNNLVPSCKSCNMKKLAKTAEEFINETN